MSARTRRHLATALGLALALVPAAATVAGAQPDDGPPVRQLEVEWVDPDEVRLPQLVDELAPATVLSVRAHAFPADTTGSVVQCATGASRRCGNRLPVRSDDRGVATFQYLVTDDVDPAGGCRLASTRRCTVELDIGGRTAVVDTVFVDPAPAPGELTVSPRTGLRPGDTVTVQASGFPDGAELDVRVCASPATSGLRCGAPGPEASMATGADGSARTTLVLAVDEVGEAAVACGRRTRCQVVVSGSTAVARAAPVRLDFATRPGADYDPSRLAVGLAVAAVLAAAAARLIRVTDWSPPAEADGSLIDDAALADLDAEAAAFAEQEATTP